MTISRPHSHARVRVARFVAFSSAVHLLAALGLVWLAAPPWMPRLDITWLDLDNSLGAPTPEAKPATPPPAEPPRSPAPRTATRSATAAKPKARPEHRPTRPPVPKRFGTAGVALSRISPGDAALMLLLRLDRIRSSPFADAARRLIAVFYDAKTLLWSNDIDPVRDFDAMLIATPNPYRVTQTFLAIRHRLPRTRLRTALEQSVAVNGKHMRWRQSAAGLRGSIPSPPKLPDDSRVLILKPRLVLLTDPKHEDMLRTAPRPTQDAAPDGGADAPTLVDRLAAMNEEGGRGRGPGLLLQAINLPRLIRLPPDVPPPINLQVTIPASDPAQLHGIGSFPDEALARRFLAAIEPRLERAKSSLLLRVMGVGALLDRLRITRRGSTVEARIRLDGVEVRELLELFRAAIPQVHVPGMPARIPADAGPDGPSPAARDAAPAASGAPDSGVLADPDPAGF